MSLFENKNIANSAALIYLYAHRAKYYSKLALSKKQDRNGLFFLSGPLLNFLPCLHFLTLERS